MEGTVCYLPASILAHLIEHQAEPKKPPFRQKYKTCVMFCDVSGFTALCEAMAAKGPSGDEYLARHLNSYFELLVRTISSQGGDVFKFAGDAILVLWPPSEEDLVTLTRRATQCALEVNDKLQNVELEEGVTVNVKVGVGVGELCIIHVGGVFGRMEYLAVGDPLVQAFHAEHHAEKRECIAHPNVWKMVSEFFEARVTDDGYAFLKRCKDPLRKASVALVTNQMTLVNDTVLRQVQHYIPSAVVPFVQHKEEKWAAELRRITVLFVNLGLSEPELNATKDSDDALELAHKVLSAVQTNVYRYEGSLNKFLMDDKGSTLVAVFGLPPLAHEDDAVRGILSALAIREALEKLGRKVSIGVSTGQAFCGIVGTRSSREYSCLGDTVNLSARLMQHAGTKGGGIIADGNTADEAAEYFSLDSLGDIKVKGKSNMVSIFQPPKGATSQLRTPKFQSSSGLGLAGLLARAAYPDDTQKALKLLREKYFIVDAAQLKMFGPKEWSELPVEMRKYLVEGSKCHQCCVGEDRMTGSSSSSKDSLRGMSKFSKSKRNSILSLNAPSTTHMKKKGTDRHAKSKQRVLSLKDQMISFSMTNAYGEKVERGSIDGGSSGSDDGGGGGIGTITEETGNRLSTASSISSAQQGPSNIRVLLPVDIGIMTFRCDNLKKISDVKRYVWTIIKTRKLITGIANSSRYSFYLQPDNIKLIDPDMKLMALPRTSRVLILTMVHEDHDAYDGLLLARAFLLCEMAKLMMPIGGALAFRNQSNSDASGGAGGDDTGGGGDGGGDGDGSTSGGGRGFNVFMEGAVGIGKTHTLTTTFTDCLEYIYGAGASQFYTRTPLMVWRSIVHQILDGEIKNMKTRAGKDKQDVIVEVASTAEEKDAAMQKEKLEKRLARGRYLADVLQSTQHADLIPRLGTLRGIVNIQIDDGSSSSSSSSGGGDGDDGGMMAVPDIDDDEAAKYAIAVVMALLKHQSTKHPIIVVVDKALYCDKWSWQLNFEVAKANLPILFILAYRPFDKIHMPPFAGPKPEVVETMLAMQHSRHILLHRRRDVRIRQIACATFGPHVKKLPDLLGQLIVTKARGVSVVASELARSLMINEFVFVQGDQVTLSHKLQYSKADIPVPTMVQGILQSFSDRLTEHQKMILKVAAVIERQGCFDVDLLRKIFPMHCNDKEALLKTEFCNLLRMRIIERPPPQRLGGDDKVVRSPLAGDDGDEDVSDLAEIAKPFEAGEKACFAYGFFRDCLLKRMTNTQFESLERTAGMHSGTIRGGDDDDDDGEMGDEERVYDDSVKESYIQKRGGARLAWKKRYCVLYQDRMEYYRRKGDKVPCGTIPIFPDSVLCCDEYKEHTFGFIPEPIEGAREFIIKMKPVTLAVAWKESIQEQITKQTSNVLSGMLRTERNMEYGDDSD